VWWYLLSEAFGYKNVKIYDGSAQDFAKDPSAPMEK
jgi:3-mercaptopyruvate sulfurtransferase SseA